MRCIASALVSMSVSTVSLARGRRLAVVGRGHDAERAAADGGLRLDAAALEDRGRDVGELGDPGRGGSRRRRAGPGRSAGPLAVEQPEPLLLVAVGEACDDEVGAVGHRVHDELDAPLDAVDLLEVPRRVGVGRRRCRRRRRCSPGTGRGRTRGSSPGTGSTSRPCRRRSRRRGRRPGRPPGCTSWRPRSCRRAGRAAPGTPPRATRPRARRSR